MRYLIDILKTASAKFLLFALLAFSLSFFQTSKSGRAINSCIQPQVISFPFAVQSGTGGVSLLANAVINGDVSSNGDILGQYFAKINGSATAAGVIGKVGISGTKIEHSTTTVNLPAINVADWQSAAAAGGVITGDVVFGVNSQGNIFGPKEIRGNLVLMENSEVILKGNLFVTGNISIAKNAQLRLSSNFGNLGTVVIAGGQIDIEGNAQVEGNGGGSFLLMASLHNGGRAIVVKANFFSDTTVFYAPGGNVIVDDNSNIIAAAGSSVEIGRNSLVNYMSGLAFANFICPSPPPPSSPPPPPVPSVPTTDLVASKTVNKTIAVEGEEIIFVLSVQNLGPATSTQVTATDTLSSFLEFLSATASPGTIYASSTGLWTIGQLAAGTEVSLNIQARVKTGAAGQAISNTLTVSGIEIDPAPANNTDSVSFTVPLAGGGTATSTPLSGGGGGTASFIPLSAAGGGPSPFVGLQMPQTLPPGLAFAPPGEVAGAIKPVPPPPKKVVGDHIIPTSTFVVMPARSPLSAVTCQSFSWWVLGFVLYALLMLGMFIIQQNYPNRYWIVFPIVLLVSALMLWWLEPCAVKLWYWPLLIILMFLAVTQKEWQQYLPEKFHWQ